MFNDPSVEDEWVMHFVAGMLSLGAAESEDFSASLARQLLPSMAVLTGHQAAVVAFTWMATGQPTRH